MVIGASFPDVGPSAAEPDGPLAMLSQLHARSLRQCATLRRLALYLSECGNDAQARRAAETVLRYFDVCAPRYCADEEDDLFPALLESMAGSDALCLKELTSGMAQQHRTLERLWARLRPAVAAVAAGDASGLDSHEVEAFATEYHSHVEREDSELLPMAARLMTDEALQQVWAAMRQRHGAPSPQPG